MDFINSNIIIKQIAQLARQEKVQAFLVGGYIRDKILGIEKSDIDISVIGDAIEFGKKAAALFDKSLDAVYDKFGTALLNIQSPNNGIAKIEFASARKESYRKSSRKPDVEFSDLKDDLSRRDFTVNAFAVSLSDDNNEIIDFFGGLEDLNEKILRTPLEPVKTFDDDPLRIMRACRFASQLNFSIESETFEAIKEMRLRLKLNAGEPTVVSQERITDEFMKILSSPTPSIGLKLLFKAGIMEIIFPEIHALEGVDQRKDFHHKDVFYHTLQVVDNTASKSNNLWLRFAALMHDIAKPPTKKFVEGIGWTFHGHEELGARWQKKIFQRMKLPYDKLPYVEKLVRLHLRPIALAEENVTDSAIRRLIFEAGDDIEDLLTLCRSDITSKDPDKVSKFLGNFDRVEKRIAEVEERDNIRNFQSPIRGEEIMKICNLTPSREVGIIKKKIEEAILDGIIPNEYEAALDYLNKIKDEALKIKS
ncbi:MAG TPA: CCA tRNA nucleotidyltransferase [Ignavibacteria bacterium]|nr:CCA tRNA nucleotidyltransferase [Ignavibacteria bacterium]